jgi:hypothetical protein
MTNDLIPGGAMPPAPRRAQQDFTLVALDGEKVALADRRQWSQVLVCALRVSSQSRELGGLEGARRLLEGPTEHELLALSALAENALAVPPDAKANRVFVGILLDVYPAGAGDVDAFKKIVSNDLVDEGFPPIVVAEALQTLRRTSKFRPALSEIVDACHEGRRRWTAQLKLLAELVDERRKAETTVSRYSALPSRSG